MEFHAIILVSVGDTLKMDQTIIKMHYQTGKMDLIVILQMEICAIELL